MRDLFEDREAVRVAFREFIYNLVWESYTIDECEDCATINDHIGMYVDKFADKVIDELHADILEYTKSTRPRYEVFCVICDEDGEPNQDLTTRVETDDLTKALEIGAKFYRLTKNPIVNIYDNMEDAYIAEWD